jgi:hypothetical protein
MEKAPIAAKKKMEVAAIRTYFADRAVAVHLACKGTGDA